MITDLRRGSTLAGYRIEALLGRGGMGVVYLATDVRLERKVALKLVAPGLSGDARFRERFLRESRLAASLDHSHVVPVYDAGEADAQLYLSMRYVDGEDLGTLLGRTGPLAPSRAVELVSQVAEALDEAHAHGLVHRDVKPANVLVTEEGGREHCYLSDFGLARSSEAAAEALSGTHLSGTVDYTAPEQIASEPADGRADLYSLGCVLFECLAGEPPFKRPRAVATLFAHASEPPPSLHATRPELPEEIDGVIARALAKDPGERYASCCELADAAGEALGLTPESRVGRRRLLALLAAVAALVAAAVAVPALLLTGGESGPQVVLPVTKNTLLQLDPETGEPVAGIPLGEDPTYVAAGAGAVWVLDKRDRTLLEIDPRTRAVARRIDLAAMPAQPLYLLAGAGAVWLDATATGLPPEPLWRYVRGSASPVEFARNLGHVARVDDGEVWFERISPIDADALVRVDARTGKVLGWVSMPRSLNAAWVAVGEEAIWLAQIAPTGLEENSEIVERVDPATGEIVARIDTGIGSVNRLVADEGSVWVMGESLARIDPATNTVVQRIPVGRSPDRIAVGEGYVWLGNLRDQTVTRVDPSTADLLTVHVGGRLQSLAAGEDGVWAIVKPA